MWKDFNPCCAGVHTIPVVEVLQEVVVPLFDFKCIS